MPVLAAFMTVPCTVTPAVIGARDSHGNPTRTLGSPVDALCYYRLLLTTELAALQATTLTTYRVHLVPDTPVTAASVIDVDGLHLTVVGEPHIATHPNSGITWFVRVDATQSKVA